MRGEREAGGQHQNKPRYRDIVESSRIPKMVTKLLRNAVRVKGKIGLSFPCFCRCSLQLYRTQLTFPHSVLHSLRFLQKYALGSSIKSLFEEASFRL